MKLDNEQVICHSTIGYKSDSKHYSFLVDTKPFENKEKPLDSTGLSAEGIVKGNQNGVVDDIKGDDDRVSDFSPYPENIADELTASELDCSNSVHDFADGNEKEVGDFITSNSHSSKNMDSSQDSVFYLDKSVTECELPELVVCYKESTYQVVKDICIDERASTQDKFLFDSRVDEKSHCNFKHFEEEQDSELMKQKSEIDMSMEDVSLSLEENQPAEDTDNECGSSKKLYTDTCMQDGSLSLGENESNKGIPNQCESKDLMVTRELKDDAMNIITDDVSKEFTLGEVLSLPELSTVKSEAMSSDCKSDGIEQQSSQDSSKKEVIVTSAVEESNSPSEEAIVSAPGLVSADESEKGVASPSSPAPACASLEATGSSLVNEVSGDIKLETGSIPLDSGSSAPTTSKDDHKPLDTGRSSKIEETADQLFSSKFQHGETSFSAAGPVTGLITYSGPISYSGNLSLRSDSSTTSTHSFAFPILNTEWNSSPVRMAKADRRQYRKHRGWREGFLCCRF